MHPWQAVSELAPFRSWLRENAKALTESLSAAADIEPALVRRVLEALHCQALGGELARDPCFLATAGSRD